MVIVTLVHGTFAQHAPWTLDSSRLCELLRCKFANVIIKRFEWSGRNSQAARLRAGIDLKIQLKRQLAEHPSSHHFVIAHSHGGNVAMYALQDDSLRDVVALACLATPFLHFSGRWIHKHLERNYAFALAILFAVLVVVPGLAAGIWLHHDVVGWIISIIGFFLYKGIWIFSDATARKLVKESQATPPRQEQLFIARVSGDEASSALGASQFLSWVLTWIAAIAYARPRSEYKQAKEHIETYAQLTRRERYTQQGKSVSSLELYNDAKDEDLQRVRHIVDETFGVKPWHRWLRRATILSVGLLTLSWSTKHGNSTAVSVVLAGIICVISLPLFVLAKYLGKVAMFTLAFFVQAIVYGSFGKDLIFVAPWLDVTVTEAPSGYWGIHQYEKPDALTMPQWKINPYAEYLKHSSIYEHYRVLQDLCSWMEGHLHSAPNHVSAANSK